MAQGMKNTVLDHLPAGTDADLAKGKFIIRFQTA